MTPHFNRFPFIKSSFFPSKFLTIIQTKQCVQYTLKNEPIGPNKLLGTCKLTVKIGSQYSYLDGKKL